MKIAIIGTRGIPNEYGGFEQFADILSQGLVKKGHNITVYCSANHSYKESVYKGVTLIHKYDPENKIGTAGQFIYDLQCMLDARKQKFDIIYMLGYTSSSIWQKLLYKGNAIVITNMDGLEWKRSKYTKPVQQFLQYAEKLAVKHSDFLVADSIGIQSYLEKRYNKESVYFPYGSFVFEHPDNTVLAEYSLEPYKYDILIARFEPENNIKMVLEAFSKSSVERNLILIGKANHTKFGKAMIAKYSTDKRILFLGAIYNQETLNNLRYFSNLYFHGHSVGGTNPSLLEAMGSSALICYHNNEFNKTIIETDGYSFNNISELKIIIESKVKQNSRILLENNLLKIKTVYSWEKITAEYENFFDQLIFKR